MSFKIFLEKMETFHNCYFEKIEQLHNSGQEEVPAELRSGITADSEALLLKFSSYLKQMDNIIQHHLDFSFRSKKLNEVLDEKKKAERNLIQMSTSIDDLITEVKTNMKFVKFFFL